MDKLEKVIKGLECCNSGCCRGCPYTRSRGNGSCIDKSKRDALELLKEQQKIVQCNKCKYGKYDKINQKYQCEKIRQRTWFIIWHDGDFFCKDGEPKDGEQDG